MAARCTPDTHESPVYKPDFFVTCPRNPWHKNEAQVYSTTLGYSKGLQNSNIAGVAAR